MKFEEFKDELLKALAEKKPEGVTLREETVVKNGESLDGVMLMKENGGPIFYFKRLMSELEEGKTIDEIADKIVGIAEESIHKMDEQVADIMSGKGDIVLQLVDEKANSDFLEGKVAIDAGDGYKYIARIESAEASAVVSEDMLELFGWDKDMMFDCGIEAAKKHVFLSPIRDSLQMSLNIGNVPNIWDSDHLESDCYVLTSDTTRFGAVSLFLPGVVDELKRKFGEGFYAIPSSIHEFIIVPKGMGLDPEALQPMCADANRLVVAPEDVLSERISEF